MEELGPVLSMYNTFKKRSNKILFLTQFAIMMCFSFTQRFHFEATSQFGSAGTGFHAMSKLISLTMFDLNLYLCAKPRACRHVTLKGSVYNNWKQNNFKAYFRNKVVNHLIWVNNGSWGRCQKTLKRYSKKGQHSRMYLWVYTHSVTLGIIESHSIH